MEWPRNIPNRSGHLQRHFHKREKEAIEEAKLYAEENKNAEGSHINVIRTASIDAHVCSSSYEHTGARLCRKTVVKWVAKSTRAALSENRLWIDDTCEM